MGGVVSLDRAIGRLLVAVFATTFLSILPSPWEHLAWLSGAWALVCLWRVDRLARR